MPLTFRPARPADVDAAVPLIYSSGPEAFDYAFARPGRNNAQDFLRYAFAQGSGQFGWRQHWVGELDGRVVAAGTVFGGEQNLGYLLAASRQILGFFGAGSLPVIRRGLQLERIICPPPRRTLYLAHLGVTPELRGEGLGSQLIDHLLQRGRRAGVSMAALDVSAANPKAQALYERLGFRVQIERPSHLPSVADHRYMQRPL
ncbi:GNAT family N-acetyltransferase [Pseudomonas sp. ZM23]|uniref:GNAT family N-acetyltransferase n=1 Tax=Pseudomonas triclosanedens TaxID=2961893 RepID=A0ABY7A0S7_9PSED|nr:GNAT family N-acetyltransferase [Pseudomonas triclosanedens]MCP8464039.1 GNAT family N-acetyltransferase [Pseudomonas triclosanedens]MCP8469123.1 GNAT family N-acetyltransferase [Pseudomonas triclosanedens]MCP8475845.1 GNAT family N-acetyltransferase [Pseudomonas triclosanedens]WAI50452.1 GNAT family N-acetyltransferase [Pseudomonas triclosanedens]